MLWFDTKYSDTKYIPLGRITINILIISGAFEVCLAVKVLICLIGEASIPHFCMFTLIINKHLMWMNTVLGKAALPVIFPPPLPPPFPMESTLKGKNLLPLKIEPSMGGLHNNEALKIVKLIRMGSSIQGKNLLPLEQILSLKRRSHYERFWQTGSLKIVTAV